MIEHIDDSDALLRRIPDQPGQLWTRRPDGTARPSSASMKPSSDDGGLSVDVRRLLSDPAVPTSVLEDGSGLGLAEFEAGVPRANRLDVEHSPIEGNDAHANVRGFEAMSKNEAKRAQKALAEAAAWIQMPAGALELP